ncbi:MAG TPA: ATPase [Prolixibacteraceae bacterium]|jgi:NadR type nicotinamide-nucleotide adenylyltransferase|nr:ATPase [Prolixibacteraceae bacterium]
MIQTDQQIRIAVTGPESTGKTTLAHQLADRYKGQYIPEFAREYVEKLPLHYTYADVEAIAKIQVQQYQATTTDTGQLFIFDTWLIITKVWFNWVFGKTPNWLEDEILNCPIDLFLLCLPDLPWEPDPVRENGGENRLKLFDLYKNELQHYGFNFVEIGGIGEARLHAGIDAMNKIMCL